MVAVALAGFLDRDGMPPNGIILTAVLPGGCPFACPFCFVNARAERSDAEVLTTSHYAALVHATSQRAKIGAVAIVGDEPLQEQSWPYAEAMLTAATQLRIPVALITNGYNLVDFVDRLRALPGLRVMVSLDGVGSEHDEIRVKEGAFDRIVQGIRLAVAHPELQQNLTIATTMLPRNIQELPRVLALVAELGVPRMVMSPLLTSVRGRAIKIYPKGLREAAKMVPKLLGMPECQAVSLHVSDEFGLLGEWEVALKAEGVNVMRPRRAPDLIRIDAAGRIETLRTVRDGGTTGLRLPLDLRALGGVIDRLLEEDFPALAHAA